MPKTLIKICGLSSEQGIDAAISAGASHIGLVHFEKSPRHVSLQRAAELADYAGDHAETVLLTVNMNPAETAKALEIVRPDVIQLHGSETPEWTGLLRDHIRPLGIEVWRARGVRGATSLGNALAFLDKADRVLYDAPAKALPGGTGTSFDWGLLANFAHQMPWALAGGLSPDNVAQAMAVCAPPMVDVSSGVESAPGIKDIAKIAAFCEAVQHYDNL